LQDVLTLGSDPEIQYEMAVSANPLDTECFYQPLTLPSDLESQPSPNLVALDRLPSLKSVKFLAADHVYDFVDEDGYMQTSPVEEPPPL
jgi:hypothetical protein